MLRPKPVSVVVFVFNSKPRLIQNPEIKAKVGCIAFALFLCYEPRSDAKFKYYIANR